jgi:hypothetical protein
MAKGKAERGKDPGEQKKSFMQNIIEARQDAALRELRRYPNLFHDEIYGQNNVPGPVAQNIADENSAEGTSDTGTKEYKQ